MEKKRKLHPLEQINVTAASLCQIYSIANSNSIKSCQLLLAQRSFKQKKIVENRILISEKHFKSVPFLDLSCLRRGIPITYKYLSSVNPSNLSSSPLYHFLSKTKGSKPVSKKDQRLRISLA